MALPGANNAECRPSSSTSFCDSADASTITEAQRLFSLTDAPKRRWRAIPAALSASSASTWTHMQSWLMVMSSQRVCGTKKSTATRSNSYPQLHHFSRGHYMNHQDAFTGQRIDSREHNDNAPPKYSAPSASFKGTLARYANPYCSRCGGTGYIGVFKHVCAGRCFKCISETIWERVQDDFDRACDARNGFGELRELYTAVCTGDQGGPAYLCDGLYIWRDETNGSLPQPAIYAATNRTVLQSTHRIA